jgi:four helix bundle protein
MRDFRKIKAWQRAHRFQIAVHKLVRRFPRTGYASLKSQLLRASESIANGISEGAAAETNKEFARHLAISIKSNSETEGELLTARDLGLMSEKLWQRFTDEVVEIRKMTWTYRERVLEDTD